MAAVARVQVGQMWRREDGDYQVSAVQRGVITGEWIAYLVRLDGQVRVAIAPETLAGSPYWQLLSGDPNGRVDR